MARHVHGVQKYRLKISFKLKPCKRRLQFHHLKVESCWLTCRCITSSIMFNIKSVITQLVVTSHSGCWKNDWLPFLSLSLCLVIAFGLDFYPLMSEEAFLSWAGLIFILCIQTVDVGLHTYCSFPDIFAKEQCFDSFVTKISVRKVASCDGK